ncbi:hypothetical protein BFP77_06210 [Maribacter sp. 4U21]|nr:hypothetical protein [Maribacter sp. 4U21]PIB29415.1 hypothetical protein BFP77_06210 [Maribacter sp. 4U21]
MSREKRNYTEGFKEKAVELSYAHGSVFEICKELDIPTSVLRGTKDQSETFKKGYHVSRPRVAGIMMVNNLFARRKRRFKVTTDSEHNFPLACNILNQNFTVFRKNQVWLSDITVGYKTIEEFE